MRDQQDAGAAPGAAATGGIARESAGGTNGWPGQVWRKVRGDRDRSHPGPAAAVAPELGCRETAAKPVTARRACSSSSITSR